MTRPPEPIVLPTIVHHSADFDGKFSGEIARSFLPVGATVIGWDFGQPQIPMAAEGDVYVIDLPPECLDSTREEDLKRVIWIDHHATSMAKWGDYLRGYRIDGVAACRLAWQWFHNPGASAAEGLPRKEAYVQRLVNEPLAVRLVGEYDVWDKRDPRAEIFQYGLKSINLDSGLLSLNPVIEGILKVGEHSRRFSQTVNATMMERSFLARLNLNGLLCLCLNVAWCNSQTFASRDVPGTGHEALLGFYFNGRVWVYSLYHAAHRTELDLSLIAVALGGGGHKGACGFRTAKGPSELLIPL